MGLGFTFSSSSQMEATGGNPANSSISSNRRSRVQFSAFEFIRSPVHTLLEYSGLLRPSPRSSTHQLHECDSLLSTAHSSVPANSPSTGAEVSIRIIGAGDQDHVRSRLSTSINSAAPVTNVAASEQSSEAACPAGAGSSFQQLPASAELGVRGESVSANAGSQSSIVLPVATCNYFSTSFSPLTKAVLGEVQYFIGVQLHGTQHVEPLQNGIPVEVATQKGQLVKETAENIDVA